MRPAATHARACAGLLAGLAACAPVAGGADKPVAHPRADYLGAEVSALDKDDLVRVVARMKGRPGRADLGAYADCAVARAARDGGNGFARHVRTNVDEKGGVWRADAVYTISPTLPRGLMTIDAEVKVAECADEGVPTE